MNQPVPAFLSTVRAEIGIFNPFIPTLYHVEDFLQALDQDFSGKFSQILSFIRIFTLFHLNQCNEMGFLLSKEIFS
ncbi:MAG: hypothetical protein IJQ31_00925 [Thermoguttaceae bacterium]|nr:hypothetical protein [Thermoguttaceae bacterium]